MFKAIAARTVNTIKAAVPHTPQDAAALARANAERAVRMGHIAGGHSMHALNHVVGRALSLKEWSK